MRLYPTAQQLGEGTLLWDLLGFSSTLNIVEMQAQHLGP